MYFHLMPLTPDQIVEEVRHWPQSRVTELLDRLTSTLHTDSPTFEAAWKQETRRRIAEIESGAVQGIPGEEVSTRIRKLVGR
jgi:putative addiction module component (TIGR02574 family)